MDNEEACGIKAGVVEEKVRDMRVDEIKELRSAIDELERQVAQLRINHATPLVHAARRRRYRSLLVGTAGLSLLPLSVWAAIQLTPFERDTPIRAAEVNANFAALRAGLDGPLVLSEQPFGEQNTGPVVVRLATLGGRVRVELIPAVAVDPEEDPSTIFVPASCSTDSESTSCRSTSSRLLLERSGNDEVTWERRAAVELGFNSALSGLPGHSGFFSPSAVSFVDEAPEGQWSYRIVIEAAPGAFVAADIRNAYLSARELGTN